jgi:hypothetical protein
MHGETVKKRTFSFMMCRKNNVQQALSLFNRNGAHDIYYSVTFRITYGTVHQLLTRILKFYQYSERHRYIFIIKKLHFFSKSSTANIRATIRFKTRCFRDVIRLCHEGKSYEFYSTDILGRFKLTFSPWGAPKLLRFYSLSTRNTIH